MNQTFHRIIEVISKPVHLRRRTDIEVLLPWLRNKSDVLAKTEQDVLTNLLSRCTYQRKIKDDIIITQGETGDSFYIILSGTCSVYIDPLKTGEDQLQTVKRDKQEKMEQQHTTSELRTTENRGRYGKLISTIGAGKSFGEIALLSDDSTRNASIIADEETDLLVIERELFKDTLEAKKKEEYTERATFANKCPLFSNWNTRFKKLLEMSLIKVNLPFGATIVKQGEPVNGLFFITKGEGKIIIDSSTHEAQFQKVFDPSNSVLAKELGKVYLKTTKKIRDSVQQEQIRIRRRDGYAAAEKRLAQKAIALCFVDESEVIGDVELVLGLDTYMQSVVCTANTELFLLDSKNIDRLITKKHPQTLNYIREQVEKRIKVRSQSKIGSQINLFPHLLEALQLIKPKKVSLRQERAFKILTSDQKKKEQTLKQLVKLYLKDRAPLIEPYVPGAVYYKTKAEQKMKGAVQDQSAQPLTGQLRLERARKAAKRQPRSRRELERLTIAQDPEEITKLQDHNHAVNRFLQRKPSGSVLPQSQTAVSRDKADPIFELTEPQMPESGEEVDLTDLSQAEVKEVVVNLGNASDTTNATRSRVICAMMEKNAQQNAVSKYKYLVRPTSAPARRGLFEDEVDDEVEVFDAETSDHVLKGLEVKLRSFYQTNSGCDGRRMVPQIQKLKRFQIASPDDVPVPGGTVFVRQKSCKYPPGSQISTSQHQHIRRFLIPKDAYAVAKKSMTLIEKALENEQIKSPSLRPTSAPIIQRSIMEHVTHSGNQRPKTATAYRHEVM